jgi:selenocysteine lyase/cysteine desulfurase
VDVRALGCDFYAASGQKWLCGPNGIGYLYARAERIEGLRAPWPGFHAIEDPHDPLGSPLQPDARRLGTGYPAYHQLEWAHAALDVFEEAGMSAVHESAVKLAAELASRLAERGVDVAPRGRSTLVSFEVADPPAAAQQLFAHGIVLRHLPGAPYLRASVGAWNSEEEIERLTALVSERAR